MFMSAAVGRYFMGFIPTMAAAIFLTYRSPGTELSVSRERRCLWLVTALVLIAFILKSLMHIYFFAPKLLEAQPAEAHTATVQKLEQLGIKPRDKVMRVAKNEGGEYYWAHLADVRVIAECVSPEEFLRMQSTELEQLDAILRSKGVKAIVLDWTNRKSSDAAPKPISADWQNVRGTNNFVRLVPQ
jgi:hypothetical protein